eukprot:TRINITY_DN1300_c2_g5_i1.p1 TRINITY_DN1300_c2_g5~~TRINITY_DN1300_c2_g5_i1.p1  ORF type:complete len:1990 (+),score=647.72 TRINITY_DN1300_c2_g5_i1:96-6065(+)
MRRAPKRGRRHQGRESVLQHVPAQKVLSLVPRALQTLFRAAGGAAPNDGVVAEALGIEPKATPFDGAALFVDVSGFSSIASRLEQSSTEGAEQLTHHLNEYFTSLLSVVRACDGDVANFSGDAILVQWGGEQAARRAVECGWRLMNEASGYDFSLPDASSADPAARIKCEMRIHVGAACGSLAHLVVGGSRDSGEYRYVLSGRPVEVCGIAAGVASTGQMGVNKDCYTAAREQGLALDRLGALLSDAPATGGAGPYVIVSTSMETGRTVAIPSGMAPVPELSAGPRDLTRDDSATTLPVPEAIAPPEGDTGELLKLCCARFLFDTALHAVLSEVPGELRTVYTVFIKLCDIGCSIQTDPHELHKKLDAAVKVVQRGVARSDGMLNKALMDDKGVLLLAFYGVPQHMHEDDALRAVTLGVRCERRLRREVGRSAVGISRAKVFCGLTGSPWRCEYTAMGDGVNIAARLMGVADENSRAAFAPERGQVVCDADTAAAAEQADAKFYPVGDVVLKGQAIPLRAYRAVLKQEATEETGSDKMSSGSGGPRAKVRQGGRPRSRDVDRASVTSSQSTASNASGRLSQLMSASTTSLLRYLGPGGARTLALPVSPSMQQLPDDMDGSPRSSGGLSLGSLSSRGSVGPGRLGAVGRCLSKDSVGSRNQRPIGLCRVLSKESVGSQGAKSPPRFVPTSRSATPHSGGTAPTSPRDAVLDPRGAAGTRLRDAQRRLSGERLDLESGLQSPGGNRPADPAPSPQLSMSQRSSPGWVSPRGSVPAVLGEEAGMGARGFALIGRQQELQALHALVGGMRPQRRGQAGPRSGSPQRLAFGSPTAEPEQDPFGGERERRVVLYGGVQMGKTAVLAKAQDLSVARGITVLWISGLEAHVDSQYGAVRAPLLRIFSHVHVHIISSAAEPEAGDNLRFLHFILPVVDLDPVTDADRALPPGEKLQRINAAALLVFKQHCGWPFLMLVDDMQWIDDATLTFIYHAAQEGVRMVAAERLFDGAEMEQSVRLQRVPSSVAASSSVCSDHGIADSSLAMEAAPRRSAIFRELGNSSLCLTLAPLTTEQQAAVLRQTWGAEGVDPGLLRALTAKAGGSPGFMVQMAQVLGAAGLVEVGPSGRAVQALGVDISEALVHAVPVIEAFVMRAVDRLDAPARKVCAVASVLAAGADLDYRLLHKFLKWEGLPQSGEEQIAELVHLGVLEWAPPPASVPGAANVAFGTPRMNGHSPGVSGGLRFARPLARDVIYNTILASERRRLHGLAAELMAEQPDADMEQLTAHLRKVGDLGRAVQPATAAYLSCIARGQVAEAWSYLQLLRQVSTRPAAHGWREDVTHVQRVRWAFDSVLCLYELGHLLAARDECTELASVIADGMAEVGTATHSGWGSTAPSSLAARRSSLYKRLSFMQRKSSSQHTNSTPSRASNLRIPHASPDLPLASTPMSTMASSSALSRCRQRKPRPKQPIVRLLECCCPCIGAPVPDGEESPRRESSTRRRSKGPQRRSCGSGEEECDAVWQMELAMLAAELALWIGSSEDLEEAVEMAAEVGTTLGACWEGVLRAAHLVLVHPPSSTPLAATAGHPVAPGDAVPRENAACSPFSVLCFFAQDNAAALAAQHPWAAAPAAVSGEVTLSPLPGLHSGGQAGGKGYSPPPYRPPAGTRPVTVRTFAACSAALWICAGQGDLAMGRCAALADTDDGRWAAHGHMLRAFLMLYYAREVVPPPEEQQLTSPTARTGPPPRLWLRPDEPERVAQSAGSPAADGDSCVQRFACVFCLVHVLRSSVSSYPVSAALGAVKQCESAQVLLPQDCIPLAALAEALCTPRATDGIVSLVVAEMSSGDDEDGGLFTPERRLAAAGRVLTVLGRLAQSFPFTSPALYFTQGLARHFAKDFPAAFALWWKAIEAAHGPLRMPHCLYAWRAAARLCLDTASSEREMERLLGLMRAVSTTPSYSALPPTATETARAELRQRLISQASSRHFVCDELQLLQVAH